MTNKQLRWAPLTCGFLFTILLGSVALANEGAGLRAITAAQTKASVDALAADAMQGRAAGKTRATSTRGLSAIDR